MEWPRWMPHMYVVGFYVSQETPSLGNLDLSYGLQAPCFRELPSIFWRYLLHEYLWRNNSEWKMSEYLPCKTCQKVRNSERTASPQQPKFKAGHHQGLSIPWDKAEFSVCSAGLLAHSPCPVIEIWNNQESLCSLWLQAFVHLLFFACISFFLS